MLVEYEDNKSLVDYFDSKETMRNYAVRIHGWKVTLHKDDGKTVKYNCNVTARGGEATVFFNEGNILFGELTFTYDWELMSYELFKDIFKVLVTANIVI